MYVLPIAKHSEFEAFAKLDPSVVLGVTMSRFYSTDPRDRIYALLGMPFSGNLLDDKDSVDLEDLLEAISGIASVKPAYGVRSVYIDATRRMLGQDGRLRPLSAVHHGAEADSSWPSWVPRWDSRAMRRAWLFCQRRRALLSQRRQLRRRWRVTGPQGPAVHHRHRRQRATRPGESRSRISHRA